MKYVITPQPSGMYTWGIQRNDGSVMATCPTLYPSLATAKSDIKLIQSYAASAPIVVSPVSSSSSVSSHSSSSSASSSSSSSPATLLQESDFSYLGYYSVDTSLSVGWNVGYSQGLAFRYVGGQLRFLSLFYPDTGQPLCLLEFTPPAEFGGSVVQTNRWNDIFSGGSVPNQNGNWYGLWWEEAQERLWTTYGIDYPNVTTQGGITYSAQTRTLNDDGSVSNLRGPWGLSGVSHRAVMGGVTPIPQSFQQQYQVGPYGLGFGGYASLMCQGGTVSMGPTLFTIDDPTASPDNSNVAFKTLMDYRDGTCNTSWYPGATQPTAYDRGVRNANVQETYDGWTSPAPDGFGRWTWGDSAFQTGIWINTNNKNCFIIMPSFCSGKAFYQNSTLNCEARSFEVQVFSPALLGQVATGAVPPWAVKPTNRWPISLDGFGGGGSGNGPTGGIAAACFDPSTSLLYVYGVVVNGTSRDTTQNRIFVYKINA